MTPDEQEAFSRKYTNSSLRVLPLSSGRYAVFLPFDNTDGMPLAKIGEWAELESVIRDYREPERLTAQRAQDEINLEELFGDTLNANPTETADG